MNDSPVEKDEYTSASTYDWSKDAKDTEDSFFGSFDSKPKKVTKPQVNMKICYNRMNGRPIFLLWRSFASTEISCVVTEISRAFFILVFTPALSIRLYRWQRYCLYFPVPSEEHSLFTSLQFNVVKS